MSACSADRSHHPPSRSYRPQPHFARTRGSACRCSDGGRAENHRPRPSERLARVGRPVRAAGNPVWIIPPGRSRARPAPLPCRLPNSEGSANDADFDADPIGSNHTPFQSGFHLCAISSQFLRQSRSGGLCYLMLRGHTVSSVSCWFQRSLYQLIATLLSILDGRWVVFAGEVSIK